MMPSPTNTAVIKHSTNCDNFPSDLQTVYKRIIHGNNTVNPTLRSSSSARLSSPRNSNSKSDLALMPDSPNQRRASDNSPSTSSTEEIIITQLPFHVRERPLTSGGSSNVTTLIKPTRDHVAEKPSITVPNTTVPNQPGQRIQSKTAQMLWASAYSEQSIRYVTEQVALEQARQRKRLSSIQGHRIDRRYFVNGSGVSFDRTLNSRVNSAFIDRVSQRNQLSRHHLFKNSYQPKSQTTIDLMISGQARVGQSLEVKPPTATLSAVEVKQTNIIKCNNQLSERSPETVSPVNSDSTVSSSTEIVNSANGEANDGCNHAKPTDKSVRSVTFILPDEDSIAA